VKIGYGAWRDLLLGAQFLNGRGELITAGGKTVKNVAGYDLTKFMVGQRGIFGKPITITTRTYRRPAAAILARFEWNEVIVNQLIASPLKPQWMLMTANNLDCGYLGDEVTLEFYHQRLESRKPKMLIRQTLVDDTEYRARLWKPNDQPAHGWKRIRASVPPKNIEPFVQAADLADWIADPAFGVVVATCEPQNVNRVTQAARDAGGSVYFLGQPPIRSEVEINLLKRLKTAFDPDGKLAPLDFMEGGLRPTNSECGGLKPTLQLDL